MILSKLIEKSIQINEALKNRVFRLRSRLQSKYYTHAFAECGEDLCINGKPIIYMPSKIHVGSHVTINGNVQIAPRGGIY